MALAWRCAWRGRPPGRACAGCSAPAPPFCGSLVLLTPRTAHPVPSLLAPSSAQLVKQLLARGNTVIATARKPAAAGELRALQGAGASRRLHITQLDVAAPESVESWAAGIKALAPHVDVSGGVWAAGPAAPHPCALHAPPHPHPAWEPAPNPCEAALLAPDACLLMRLMLRRVFPAKRKRPSACACPPATALYPACLPACRPVPRMPQLLVNNAGVTDGWRELGEVTAKDMLDCFVPNCIGGCRVPAAGSEERHAGSPAALLPCPGRALAGLPCRAPPAVLYPCPPAAGLPVAAALARPD